jgi:hypothetical protein
LLKATAVELKLAKLLFDNQHKISSEEWEDYMVMAETDANKVFSPEERLEIFQLVFADVAGHESFVRDFRLFPK